ncbi:MAG: acetate kinase [Acidobacteria bacterium]|nr:MAG: acetate kinase [Acidobacteriota bacterium]
MKILVLNAGSSSHKVSLYQLGENLPDDPPPPLWEAKIDWHDHIGADAVEQLITTLWRGKSPVLRSSDDIDMVGHRIVHGGRQYEEPVRITPAVKAGIAGVSAFAPLHNRGELEVIDVIEKLFGDIPQIAVFDTGFHRSIPPAAAVYPGPYEWFTEGIRRYGFHGINHQYCAGRAARLLKRDLKTLRLITCHLGNGCSLAAIRGGHSIDTTMGFTPLEGLMMGTRSGSIDPGILPYLLRGGRLQPEEIDDVLNRKSGLLGISGLSSDMRNVLAAIKQGHSRARLAFDIYVHRLQAGIGAMAAVLGGIDALVFTAGVGENSPEVREAACKPLSFLGLKLDEAANAQTSPDADIATAGSQVRVLLIRAQEDWAIARECWEFRGQTPNSRLKN